jgi:CTP synthase (UTP-ammonia lyase)
MFDYTNEAKICRKSGPSSKRDIENIGMYCLLDNLETLSPHDQAEIYNAGNFMMLNKEEIVKTSTKLVLSLVKTKGFKALEINQ